MSSCRWQGLLGFGDTYPEGGEVWLSGSLVSCQGAGEHGASCLNTRVHAGDVKLKDSGCS